MTIRTSLSKTKKSKYKCAPLGRRALPRTRPRTWARMPLSKLLQTLTCCNHRRNIVQLQEIMLTGCLRLRLNYPRATSAAKLICWRPWHKWPLRVALSTVETLQKNAAKTITYFNAIKSIHRLSWQALTWAKEERRGKWRADRGMCKRDRGSCWLPS